MVPPTPEKAVFQFLFSYRNVCKYKIMLYTLQKNERTLNIMY